MQRMIHGIEPAVFSHLYISEVIESVEKWKGCCAKWTFAVLEHLHEALKREGKYCVPRN